MAQREMTKELESYLVFLETGDAAKAEDAMAEWDFARMRNSPT